jgi:putative transcriptional regulator
VHPIARRRAHDLAVFLVPLALAFIPLAQPRDAPAPPPAPTPGRIAGQFLVALEELRDPRFFHTVIYVVQHDRNGAMGLVINRPLGDVPVGELFTELGLDPRGSRATIRVHYGGPVEPRRGFMLHTTDYLNPASQLTSEGVALTVAPAILEAVARGGGPRRSLFALGYAGWAPGQLEAEIDHGAWVTVPSDPELIFGGEAERKWEHALARKKTDI